MTNANAPVKGTAPAKVTLEVPEGLTAEQYQKLLSTFGQAYLMGVQKGEADKIAYKRLHDKYAVELKALRNEERKKRNLPAVGAKAS